MKLPRFRLVLVFAAVAASFITAGCGPQDSATTAGSPLEPELRVGITSNAPPFAFRQAGSITGLEPALAALLGDFLGKRIAFVEVPWEKQLEYLNSGKTDIVMSGMSITRQRSSLVNFSKPYLRSGQIMLVRLEDQQRFSTGVESLLNTSYRIGTVADTVSDLFVTAAINGANEIVFAKPQDAVDALIRKDIDTFVYDAPIICYFAARHQQDKLIPILTMATEEYIGWAIRTSDTDLLARVNEFIDQISSRGDLQREINYWIPYLNR
ncbi:MAG: transporter substrate-binding domain-containing protein [Desulfofustis sp.]|nr:transporter substrate-binding domain-containing protein [Desulfofustis sp.]